MVVFVGLWWRGSRCLMEFWFRMNYHLVSRLFTSILASFVFFSLLYCVWGPFFIAPDQKLRFERSVFNVVHVVSFLCNCPQAAWDGIMYFAGFSKFSWLQNFWAARLDILPWICPVFLSCMACHAPFGSVRSSLLFWLGIMVKGALVRAKGDDAKAH